MSTFPEQAHRYLVAIHGSSYVFRAPETFGNLVERWLVAVAGDDVEFGDRVMTKIEAFVASNDESSEESP